MKRKDDYHAATHSLTLLWIDDQFLKLTDRDRKRLVLTHDLLEDTSKTREHISLQFDEQTVKRTVLMTEDRTIEDYLTRLIAFVRQLKTGDVTVVETEVLDRTDELCSIAYIFQKRGNDSLEQIENRIARKFAKCAFMVEEVSKGHASSDLERLRIFFWRLYESQKEMLQANEALIQRRLTKLRGLLNGAT